MPDTPATKEDIAELWRHIEWQNRIIADQFAALSIRIGTVLNTVIQNQGHHRHPKASRQALEAALNSNAASAVWTLSAADRDRWG